MTDVIRQLGRYELLRRIAVGGMGEIFLARMRGAAGFEKRVIIKTILPHLAEEEEFVTKFLDEGRIVVQLTHGNIVPVFDMGEEDSEYFIAMEYIPGRDLREVIKRLSIDDDLLPLNMSVHIIIEVCKGLGYAHRKLDEEGQELNIVHRDVSPSNILISHEGEVKVIDFGIARATSRSSQTVSGRIQGKFNYMSPEQASGKIVDERSDVFSTGVVLYEMLTGLRPFQGDTDLETLDLVRRCQFDPPSVFNPKIPEELDEIVQRALCRELKTRYSSIDQMQSDLLRFLYTSGHAPSSKDFIAYLSDLFPDGVERRDLKFNTSSKSASQKKISLDDAMDMELERLLGGTPDIDPLTATAASVPDAEPVNHTATLMTTPPPTGLSDAFKPTPSELDHTADAISPSEDLQDAESDSNTTSDSKNQDNGSFSHETSSPATNSGTEDTEHTEDSQTSKASDDSDTKAQLTPVHVLEGSNTLIPTPEETSGPITLQTDVNLLQMKGAKRALIVGAVILTLAVAGGIIGANVWKERSVGMLVVESDPPGAHIYVDGARLQPTTPATIELGVGAHNIQLSKLGFKRSDKLKVRIKRGKTASLTPQALVLVPQNSPVKARRFRITSTPVSAKIEWSTKNKPPQKGVTPMLLELQPGQFANVTVLKEGCQSRAMPITYDTKNTDIHIELTCPEKPKDPPDLGTTTTPPKQNNTNTPRIRRPKTKRFTVRTTPPRVALKMAASQGQLKTGASPQTWTLPLKNTVTITASKPGYSTITKTYRVSAIPAAGLQLKLAQQPMGCLTFKAGYPQVNEYILDGKNLGARTGLKKLAVTAGAHELIVRNKTIKKSERFKFNITPGDKCYRKFVWPLPH